MARQNGVRRTDLAGDTAAGDAMPDKLYFRIGEAARICGVPSYVLRFWEGEFAQLRPGKGGTGQRLYRRRDVEMVLRIKALLYDEGYTIPGARQMLRGGGRADGGLMDPQMVLAMPDREGSGASVETERMRWVRAQLGEILELLARADHSPATALRTRRDTMQRGPVPPAETLFDLTEGQRTAACRTGEEGER